MLNQAVHSSFKSHLYESHEDWKSKVGSSDVRLQWDPDHGPKGDKLERRAVQLGMRGEILAKYAREWIVEIEDVSDFAREQSNHVDDHSKLFVPDESIYPVPDSACENLEIDWR